MEFLDNSIKTHFNFIQTDVFTIATTIILLVFTAFILPNITNYYISFLDNSLVKFIIFLLIAYISKFNPSLAIITTIAILSILIKLNKFDYRMFVTDSENFEHKTLGKEIPLNSKSMAKIQDKLKPMDKFIIGKEQFTSVPTKDELTDLSQCIGKEYVAENIDVQPFDGSVFQQAEL